MLLPFVVMLLCIAVLPLIPRVGEWWEENLHKLYVSLILGVPVAIWLCVHGLSHDLIHQMIYDYVPFILLLMALFVTTGGICIRGDLTATPMTNTVIMAIGTSPNPLINNTTEGLEVNSHGGIIIDENGLTSKDKVYAGGDAVTGAATVISAMGAGKLAARSIDEYIKKYPVIIFPIINSSFFLNILLILTLEFFSFILRKEYSELNSCSLKFLVPLIIFFFLFL